MNGGTTRDATSDCTETAFVVVAGIRFAEMASHRGSSLPTIVVNANGVVWALVLISALIVGASSSSSPLFDEDDSGTDTATELGNTQNFAVDDTYGSMRTADSERKENMKKLLLLALLKLAKENREHKAADELRLNGAEESSDGQLSEQKRGRWQGFCFRKSRSGRIHPYICWKGSDK